MHNDNKKNEERFKKLFTIPYKNHFMSRIYPLL
jgi:hypothetical protein